LIAFEWSFVAVFVSDVLFDITRSDGTFAAFFLKTFVWVYVDIDSDICVISVPTQSNKIC